MLEFTNPKVLHELFMQAVESELALYAACLPPASPPAPTAETAFNFAERSVSISIPLPYTANDSLNALELSLYGLGDQDKYDFWYNITEEIGRMREEFCG